jgi:hypothetical protein
MKSFSREFICSILIVISLLVACDNKESITEPVENPSVSEPIITVTGQVLPFASSNINTIGLFHYYWGNSIKEDNTVPFASTTVTDSGWVLEIPDISNSTMLDSVLPTQASSEASLYKFFILGWDDIDDDGRLDPRSGEVASFSHAGDNKFNVAVLWFRDDSDKLPFDNWIVGSDSLKNNNHNWNVIDVSLSPQVDEWTYRNDTYSMLSNIVQEGGYYDQGGYTIWFSTSDVSCSSSSLPRPKMNIRYPDLTVRTFFDGEILINMLSDGNTDRNNGYSGLTKVDTTNDMRIEGWVVLEAFGGFNDDDTARVYGTFNVPYCP